MPPAATKSKRVILKLSPDRLSKFPSDSSDRANTSSLSDEPPSQRKSNPTEPQDTPYDTLPRGHQPTPPDSSSNNTTTSTSNGTNGTSDPSSQVSSATATKRKGVPGPKPGTKRGASNLTPEGLPKPRGKPGPKKKPRIGELKNDPLAKGPFAAPAPIHKLGPKANQGAINAGLRALDRTGKPCRKWEKKGFAIKSFTGVMWDVPTWRAPKRSTVDANGDVQSDSPSSSNAKAKDESSGISDKSNRNGSSTPLPPPANGVASSPVPVAAAS